ncbi:ATP-binding protein [Methylocystis heyeri]|uniref:AAA domain-containing protein n=1 Tax=Methylocystis heyeri TaxID=391905 RepID=A0A6B8KIN8_9HYPH|nr:AAA family ATPase [Methylocystis heyeri]QGM46403.1 AAA domain-containing protein [Methylocystis heyeri]
MVARKTDDRQRPPAETLYFEELEALRRTDKAPKPPGWRLSLRAVETFILGGDGRPAKIVCARSLIERAMVTLATSRALLLIGEPGTAKSLLSELLAAAICGESTLTIQGGAALTEDQIKYGWNYALLVSEGPTPRALVPAPLHRAMSGGKIARFEEITRCPAEVQDGLLSILSDRVMAIPELGDEAMVFAAEGFNLIATANTRDRGVNDMSAALKRRFNFETVFPIRDADEEMALVKREAEKLLLRSGVPAPPEDDVLEVLVSCFRELRSGVDGSGVAIERLTSAMSTAEAVSVAHAIGVRGHFLRGDRGRPEDIVECLAGAAAKDNPEDLAKLRRYLEQRAGARKGDAWRALHAARHLLTV